MEIRKPGAKVPIPGKTPLTRDAVPVGSQAAANLAARATGAPVPPSAGAQARPQPANLEAVAREVIRGLYYEGKNNKALANDMNITPQYVSLLKRKGLSRMKKLLKIKYPEQDILK